MNRTRPGIRTRVPHAFVIATLFSVLCVASSPRSATATWVVNGNALCTAPAAQGSPLCVSDDAGGAIVAWTDSRFGNFDIFAQRVNADGSIAAGWGTNGVAICTEVGDQTTPVIASDGAGGAIIAWMDTRSGIGNIYAQRVTGAGTVPAGWPPNGVGLCTLPSAQLEPTIASDGEGGAILAWVDERFGPGIKDIYAARINEFGAVLPGWIGGVGVATGPGNQYLPSIVPDSAHGGIVAWWDNSDGIHAYAGRVNYGSLVRWNVQLCNASTLQQRLAITSDGSGGAIVAWADNRSPQYDLFGQRVNNTGDIQWGAGGAAICTANGYQDDVAIASDGADGAFVTWSDGRMGGADIFAQRMDGGGNPLWGNDGIPVCTATGDQNAPRAIPDGIGGVVLAWADARDLLTLGPDIYAQHLDDSGFPALPVDGLAICVGTSDDLEYLGITSDGATGAILAWRDQRNLAVTSFDIYAQRLYGYGAPILEPGFPVALPSGVISPPAICELDGTAGAEIVFGDEAGNIQAYNHDGTVVPGWPRNVGTIPADSPVAVGDLDGDGRNEVFCGNTAGLVYGFAADGAPLPGWPVDLGTNASTYCSIGDLTGTSHRQVVACSGDKLDIILPDGSIAPFFPFTTTTPMVASAAIGDIDGDGDKEIAILQTGGYMDVVRADATIQAFRFLGGKHFSNAPTLADLNLDGDLEIVAPTEEGDVYVMNPDATDYPGGWPYHDPSDAPVTSVALAQIRSTSPPELIFAVSQPFFPTVHAFYQDKVELSGYPRSISPVGHLYGMPIVDVTDNGSSDALIGAPDGLGYVWTNFGVNVPGWPKALPALCEVSPASGDVDSDGRVEVVFTTLAPPMLLMYDLGGQIFRDQLNPTWWWSMYAYNPQRQGCLNCGDDVGFLGVPGPERVTRVQFEPPRPNPFYGSTSFRFTLPSPSRVRLTVFDLQGRVVREIVKAELSTGPHVYDWDGTRERGGRAGVGLYYARLESRGVNDTEQITQKLTLLR